jgi:hypothetical protein
MKHTTAGPLLSRELLCFVRDHAPTVDEFTARFGGSGGQAFHVLRKAGAVVVEGDRVRLSPRHLSPDGMRFVWGCRVFLLDRDQVLLVRWGAEGPSNFTPDAGPCETP